MDNRACFLFGHATTPDEVLRKIESTAEKHYLQYGIKTFVVGNRGRFDSMAATAIKSLKRKYPDILLLLLLAYHPAERPLALPKGFDNSFYPPLENTPRRYAIVRANRYMVSTSDSLICYVQHLGNARNLLQYAQSTRTIPIENLAQAPQKG